MSDIDRLADQAPHALAEDPLDELLGDAVVIEAGDELPPEEVAPDLASLEELTARAMAVPEPRVSPVFWAAAVVWNVLGGVGGWVLLRRTHPRTARRLLVVGVVSFVVVAAVVTVAVLVQRAANPNYIFIRK